MKIYTCTLCDHAIKSGITQNGDPCPHSRCIGQLYLEPKPVTKELNKAENRERLRDLVLKMQSLELLGKETSLEMIMELQTLYNRVYGDD